MKHNETQAYTPDIHGQRSARKIQAMNTPTLTLNLLTALLLSSAAVQAAEPLNAAPGRPLDLTVPHDAKALQAWRHQHALERHKHKPYGSGYESRGLAERNSSTAHVMPMHASTATGNSQAGAGRAGGSGAGAGGGNGGSGGRAR